MRLNDAYRAARQMLDRALRDEIVRKGAVKTGQLRNESTIRNVSMIPVGVNEFAIDIEIDAPAYLVYVSEGTGKQSLDPSKSVDTSKSGISPRMILDDWSRSQEFEDAVAIVLTAYYENYLSGKFPDEKPKVINKIYVSGIEEFEK